MNLKRTIESAEKNSGALLADLRAAMREADRRGGNEFAALVVNDILAEHAKNNNRITWLAGAVKRCNT